MLTKKNKNLIITVILMALFLSVKSHGQISILPSNDTYSDQASPSQNYGSASELKINKSSSSVDEQQAFLSFDLNGVVGNYEQILLKITSPNSSNISAQLRPLLNNVNEATLTWNNQPTSDGFIYHGGVLIGNSIYYDVTQIASEKINLNETLNLLLYSNLIGDASQVFSSKDSNDVESRPKLILYDTAQIDFALFGLENVTTTTTEEGSFDSIILDVKNDYEDTIDVYGGLIQPNISYNATGFFRTQLIDGVWNYIDPLGNIFYSTGLNSVDDTNMLNLPQDLQDLGINTLGSWSDETINNIAYTPQLNVLRKFQNEVDGDAELSWDAFVLPVWEQDFESYVIANMPGWLAPYQNDPYLLGYFLDNELKFSSTQLEKSLNFAATNDQFIAADAYMTSTYGAGYLASQVTFDDEMIYVEMVADKYFSVVTTALRNVDPNHLILGTRLNGNIRYRTPIVQKTNEYCDVMSINYYREWEIQEADWLYWAEHTDIPWMTTEFYTKGVDVEGNPDDEGDPIDNIDGAGWLVPTQTERSVFFENYAIKTMQDPKCIGYHWFRFIDNNASNKGLFDSNYATYPELADSFIEINKSKYALRDSRLRGYSASSLETLSINELAVNTTVNIYPNPVSNVLNIDVPNELKDYHCALYDLGGRLIKESYNSNSIKVNDMSAGVYLLEVKDLKSNYKFVEKIAIQK